MPVLLKIELGRITPAHPPIFKSCLVLSTNRHSISELLSVSLSYSSNDSSPYFTLDLKAATEYGGLIVIYSLNLNLSLISEIY